MDKIDSQSSVPMKEMEIEKIQDMEVTTASGHYALRM